MVATICLPILYGISPADKRVGVKCSGTLYGCPPDGELSLTLYHKRLSCKTCKAHKRKNYCKATGINDTIGKEGTPVPDMDDKTKYALGKKNLAELSGVPADAPASGYAVFAPVIDKSWAK